MICLFISKGCSSCERLIQEISEEWMSRITILNVEFDNNTKSYRAYKDGVPLGERSPVETVPTLCFFEAREVYSGYSEIMEKIKNVSR